MSTFFLVFTAMGLAVLGMAAGVLLGRAPIAGSCGGLNNAGGSCSSCSRPCRHREKRDESAMRTVDPAPLTRSDGING